MADEQATEATETKKKSPLKLIILVVGALALAGGGAAGAMMFLGGGEGGQASAEDDGESEEIVREVSIGSLPTFGHIMELEPFTVNLDESAGSRYLRVQINLELEQESLEQELLDRMPVLRDTILLLLSGLRYEDISTPEGKQALKEAIQMRIEQLMRAGVVRRVLFDDFLVQ